MFYSFGSMGGVVPDREWRAAFWASLQESQLVVFKQGELVKQSKHLKHWRTRTVLLIHAHLLTFTPTTTHTPAPPTAVVPLALLASLAVQEFDGVFAITMRTRSGQVYRFRTPSEAERDGWFAAIKAEKVRMLKESKALSSILEEENPSRLTFLEDSAVPA